MTVKDTIIESALKLSEEERLEIVYAIQDSLDEKQRGYEQAWKEEIERRIADSRAGKSDRIPWETARKQIFGDH